ncbi:MAG: DPP IV N-terminal domain-containing protein [Planctomycetales bacterium]|nr:DPP IV N-terminal domain-containing protein [Planctomycetales bacterium]
MAALHATATAQQKPPKPKTPPTELTLERVYQRGDFSVQGYSAEWLDDHRYLRWESSKGPSGGQELAVYDAESGHREVLIPSERLVPAGTTTPLGVSDHAFSKDMSKVLIYTNTQRVWRQNTRGDYWILDRTSFELRQVGADAPASSLMFAKLSPNGRWVAYVRDNDIWVEPTWGAPQKPRRLTRDGSETIINGTFDWVYEEELSLRDGFRWSPDSRSIAYWQLDSDGVRRFPLVNNTAGIYPRIQWIPYPKTGQRNSSARVGLVAIDDEQSETRWINIPGDPREHYLARMDWLPQHVAEMPTLLIQQLNRLQNRNRLYLFSTDLPSRDARLIHEERDAAWVEVQDELQWSRGQLAWLSERDRWRHLQLMEPSSGKRADIMPAFDADLMDLLDVADEQAYFTASPDNATQRYLFHVALDGNSAPRRVTPDDQPGSHQYNIAPGGKWAIHQWSQFDTPTKADVVRLPSHESVRTLQENKTANDNLSKLGEHRPVTEMLQVEIEEGVTLDGWCIRPATLEEGKKYPLLIYVYGEPAGTTVKDSWGGSTQMWHRLLAQRGYVVMSFDNRGTPAPKGRAWRKSVYRQVGVQAPRDQAAAVKKVLADRDYLDPQRVGVWGWSGGGSMTLNAMLKFPELYHVGISIAPVPNQRLYDTIYQERYMGVPDDNPQGYHDGSPINFAANLKGKLLLVHGTGDDNCHYQGTEALINELVRHNKPFSMMAYPNRSHSIHEGVNTSRHLRELMTNYLLDHLPPGPR